MNVNEMMNMIDRKVGNDKEKERQKEIENKNRFDIAFKQIEALKPRIDDLIKLATYAKDNGIEYLEIPYCDFGKISEILEAFLYNGSDITTKLTREIWTGPDIPLGLPYYPNIP